MGSALLIVSIINGMNGHHAPWHAAEESNYEVVWSKPMKLMEVFPVMAFREEEVALMEYRPEQKRLHAIPRFAHQVHILFIP